jgi:gliding motility-associated-like protein
MTIITPNGDGINDLWKVEEIKQYQPCKLVIYSRWGDELFSDNNYNNTWDGTYKGKTLPEGTYYFVLETADGKVYKGAINILK